MSDTGIEHTLTKLNIEAYTYEQVIEFGKTYLIQKEIYRQGAYNYFKSHKDEIRQQQRTKYSNDFNFRYKRREQRKAYYETIKLENS